MEHFAGIVAYQIHRGDPKWTRTKLTIPDVAREVLTPSAATGLTVWSCMTNLTRPCRTHPLLSMPRKRTFPA